MNRLRRRATHVGLAFVVAVCGTSRPCSAEDQVSEDATAPVEPTMIEVQQEILALQTQLLDLQRQVLKLEKESVQELRRIRALLQQQNKAAARVRVEQGAPQQAREQPPPAREVRLPIAGGHTLGSPDAPLTLVEFTDYECGFCGRFFSEVFPRLKQDYVDSGKVRFVSRDLPLNFHKNARSAALAANCAGEQGKHWELREILFLNQRQLTATSIEGYAASLNLDLAAFQQCMAEKRGKATIDTDVALAASVGITGTPSFVLGRTGSDATDMTGTVIVGAQPYDSFAAMIDAFLDEKG